MHSFTLATVLCNRMMSELIIWGDQNNSSVLDYCLEKNVLKFFLTYLIGTGTDVQTQLLQTLSIMLQNLKNEAYIYYMLSNNHLNSLITHQFDFDDEELLGLYISLIKTISLKLNAQTVQFFFNSKALDMPLLTEAIKFFKNGDRNARIAVRTITLQVFKVNEPRVQKFILDRTAVPYFSNLAWYIREECMRLDRVFSTATTKASGEILTLAAEHIDRLYYVSDVFETANPELGQVLCDQLLHKLFLPLVVPGVVPSSHEDMLSPMVSMMFLAQLFFIFRWKPLMDTLTFAVLCQTDRVEKSVDGHINCGNIFRQALFAALGSEDDRIILASMSVILSLLDRDESASNLPLLALANMLPAKLQAAADQIPAAENALPLAELMLTVENGIRGLGDGVADAAAPSRTLSMGLLAVDALESEQSGAAESAAEPEPEMENPRSAPARPDVVIEDADAASTAASTGGTTSLADLVRLLLEIIRRHTEGLRVIVLQVAMKLVLTIKQHGRQGPLLDEAGLQTVQAALASASSQIMEHLDTPMANSIFIFVREEVNKLQQRPLNLEHVVSDPIILLPLDQERGPYVDLNKRLPTGVEESMRRDIRIFILLRQFYEIVQNSSADGEAESQRSDAAEHKSPTLELPEEWQQLFATPRFSEKEHIDLSQRISRHWKMSCQTGPKREQRYLLITDRSVLIVEPDLYRMDYAVVHHAASVLQIKSAVHNFDNCRLHMEARPNNPGCKGLPAASWNVVLIFKSTEECAAAREELEAKRLGLLKERIDLVKVLVGFGVGVSVVASPAAPSQCVLEALPAVAV
eukprot:SAG11_NODE_315_length_10858_cov_14.578977_4_plen_808_part_00